MVARSQEVRCAGMGFKFRIYLVYSKSYSDPERPRRLRRLKELSKNRAEKV